MNRFCASLLLALVGMLMAVGGWALCCYVEGARALVGGVLLLVGRRFPKEHTMKEPQRVEELPFSRISASAC